MLRVAITGGLGSGKSTVAQMFAARGAHVVSSDEVARQLMEPGQDVYTAIVEKFGNEVLREDATLDRSRLAKLAFSEGRVRELEAIVHPAVLAWQSDWVKRLRATDPHGIAMVESALVFESNYTVLRDGDVERRFDRIVLVMASDETKRSRFVQRAMAAGASEAIRDQLEADAARRLALQITDAEKAGKSDFVIQNDGELADLEQKVDEVWRKLQTEAAAAASN